MNNTNYNPELEQYIYKVHIAIKQNWSVEKKSRLLKDFLDFEKLRKYLDNILSGKIHECDMRLAIVNGNKCWNYYTKLKVLFQTALREPNARKKFLIGNVSMVCSENAI